MTAEALQRQFEGIEAGIERTIRALTVAPQASDLWRAELELVARRLSQLGKHSRVARTESRFTRRAQQLQERLRLIEQLLDGAISFYCRCGSAISPPGGYTSAGAVECLASGGQMQLEA